jgi:integrase
VGGASQLLTALCIATLFASTGARPVNSPFETLRWFDLDRRLVYVEDKRSGPTQGARLCVLSDVACDLLSRRYLPHLESLRGALASSAPKFSEQLGKLRNCDADCRLPLFFFLRNGLDFDWIEVSMTQLDIVCSSPWPLPWNLFRHLQSTYLRRKGLPAEVRDALLSHGERGAESHGAFSWRIPSIDLDVARPVINLLANDLGLDLPRCGAPPNIAGARPTDPDFARRPSFGREAREEQRQKSHAAAERAAQAEINRLLNGRPPETLSDVEWEKIGRAMILRTDGVPHAMGSVHAAVFEDYLARLWRDNRTRVRARRRYIPIEEGRAYFNEDAISAQRRIAELRIGLDAITDDRTRPPLPDLAACLAALELALHCRVSNFAVLAAVACNHANLNVVRFQGRHWLEFGYYGEWSDGRPVYRVPITARAACWIGVRQETKRRLRALPSIPAPLRNFGGIAGDRFALILGYVCGLVAQANAFELPGVIAAALSGSLECPALPHSDWVRVAYLQVPALAQEASPDSTTAESFLLGRSHPAPAEDIDDPARCAALFDAIQEVLNQPISTRRMAADVARLVKQSGFGPGSAPLVLGHYVHHLLTRSKRTDKSEKLKADTAKRYWYALKAGILDFAYDVHLPSLDDLELTELYQEIVDAAEGVPDTGRSARGGAKRRTLKADTDAGQRVRKEIRDFHEFARDIYGLEDPDWSEISPGVCAGFGRPGLVLMAEYEAILGTLAAVDNCGALDDETLSAAFVLLACARFGLRIGEAVGLSYADWVEVNAATVLLVRSNAVRGLKTASSKRQVPLVGQFDALERAVVDEVRRRWALREDPRAVQTRLLPDSGIANFRAHKNQIAKRLLPLIKAVTGSRASTVHHLRHGFACRLLALLHGRACGMGLPCDEQSVRSARRLLLQGDEPDRRTMWAVARMLGHSSPATTVKSYIHVLDQWLPLPADRPAPGHAVLAQGFVNLDALRRDDLISRLEPIAISDAVAPAQPLFWRYVQYLRLRASGHHEPASVARLSAAECQRLDASIAAVVGRLAVGDRTDVVGHLASRVIEKRWRTLAALAERATLPSPEIATAAWLPTVGGSRQIVLFLPSHFDWVARFVNAVGLTDIDCRLVYRRAADPALLDLASPQELSRLLVPSSAQGESFQLDRAVEHSPERVYPQRMVLVAAPRGRLASSYELLLLWTTWLTAGQAPGRP